MKTSDAGIAFISRQEGVVTKAYRDVAGVWTIGVGHTASAGAPVPVKGMVITRERAMQILAADLGTFEKRVNAALPNIAQNQFDGSVSFDFNTGAINRAIWVASFRAGNIPDARTRFMQWTKAGGRTVAGLVRRRTEEAHLIFDNATAKADPAPVADAQPDYIDKLHTLGFASAMDYQSRHPDLIADGVIGQATRASIDRDMAARSAPMVTTVVAGGAAVVAGVGAQTAHLNWPLLMLAAALFVGAIVGGWFLIQYHDELKRRAMRP